MEAEVLEVKTEKIKINLGHAMVDIETLGTRSHSVITAIAVVEFNLETGETGRTFYERVDPQSCLDVGLKVQGDTILWWFKQSDGAREEIAKGGKSIKEVLYLLTCFFQDLGTENLLVWGNSNRFDLGIIDNAYEACKLKLVPWKFRNERDVRTHCARAEHIKKDFLEKSLGVKHHALDDCYTQIGYCTLIENAIYIKNADN